VYTGIALFDYCPYMLSYGNLMGSLMALALRLTGLSSKLPVLRNLMLLPVFAVLSDAIENVGLIYFAVNHPNYSERLVQIVQTFTTIKFGVFFVAMGTIFPLLLIGAVMRLLRPSPGALKSD
jgi:hypothetical protein